MNYIASEDRYDTMKYRRCGRSGLKLSALSLGFWHNFGGVDSFEKGREMIRVAFDAGITHFDLANNYGPPPGSAEETFGKIMAGDMAPYRDELIISSKAGYYMWPGPYGNWGSRKYLMASLDQSLKRMGLDYVDIFYSHRPDPDTPIAETMGALDSAVRQGKALYIGLSNYSAEQTKVALAELKRLGTPCLIHQDRFSLLDRGIEKELMPFLKREGVGEIAFSPLAKGILSGKYLNGVPEDSRAAGSSVFLNRSDITDEIQKKTRALNEIAEKRGQSLAQMAVAWLLGVAGVTSVLMGVSRVSQIQENLKALRNVDFTEEEKSEINRIC